MSKLKRNETNDNFHPKNSYVQKAYDEVNATLLTKNTVLPNSDSSPVASYKLHGVVERSKDWHGKHDTKGMMGRRRKSPFFSYFPVTPRALLLFTFNKHKETTGEELVLDCDSLLAKNDVSKFKGTTSMLSSP